MPSTTSGLQRCIVNQDNKPREALLLDERPNSYHVHFIGTNDPDAWVPADQCKLQDAPAPFADSDSGGGNNRRKRTRSMTESSTSAQTRTTRKNGVTPSLSRPRSDEENAMVGDAQPSDVLGTEEEDVRPRKISKTPRKFDKIIFDTFRITPWYYSPYPRDDSEVEETLSFVPQGVTIISPASPIAPRSNHPTSNPLATDPRKSNSDELTLWVCHFCFKYMMDGASWEHHKRECKRKHPPGKKVYQRGAHMIWEIDGAKEKLYCQNLSLFGKLFIDVKTLFFDSENFLFYVLTDANSSEDHVLGYFSKEKVSYDDYNLATIMTLPQYQKKGYGMLMIEFSYELSRRMGRTGTPERPLSDLGLRSYLAYWTSTLIRFFRRVLSVLPPDILNVQNSNQFPIFNLNEVSGDVERIALKRSKKTKGFDGENPDGSVDAEAQLCMMPLREIGDELFTTERIFETKPNKYGGATTNVKVGCSLDNIAKATNMRIEDAAFALKECGFLMNRLIDKGKEQSNEVDDGMDAVPEQLGHEGVIVVITRRLVEKVAEERGIKKKFFEQSYVLP